MSARGERRISSGFLFVLRLGLAVALTGMLFTYFGRVRPHTTDLPTWLDVGFPLAICVGVLHFLRRAFQAWREMKGA